MAKVRAKSLKKKPAPSKPSSPRMELKPNAKVARKSAVVSAVNGSRGAKSDVLLPRAKVKAADTWDLSPLFPSVEAWEAGFASAQELVKTYSIFRGKLGDRAGVLHDYFEFDRKFSRLLDRLSNFAGLRVSEDGTNPEAQRLMARFQHLATQVSEATSYFRPELMALSDLTVQAYLESPELADWKLVIQRIVRYRSHTLSPGEERLIAMQGQMSDVSNHVFSQLNNSDLKFGSLKDETGKLKELSHASFSSFLQSPKRDVRKAAFDQYYAAFDGHRNTLAATLAGSIHRDVYYARARGFSSAREEALFADNVPISVYENLIGSVHKALPSIHRYYDLRRRVLKLKEIHAYDTYVPFQADMKKHHTWDQAVKVVCDSLAPLGSDYVETLRAGLTRDRWCDRYPNQGKRSGAFSSGVFDSPPYILMNFREDVLEHVFTLTHEAGHSMHTWNSCRNQPYQYSDYVIFVAEVASTFNEELLAKHMMAGAETKAERAYLLTRQIDAIRSTIVRQTMFAEFERDAHAMAEAGEAVTLESLRACYRKLLDAYFGPKFVIDDLLELECVRIPHFYRAFYVYKYSTGLAAAIALSQKVLKNEAGALDKYLAFLRSGGSKFPLDLLKDAGVDMTTSAPVDAALHQFDRYVSELETLL